MPTKRRTKPKPKRKPTAKKTSPLDAAREAFEAQLERDYHDTDTEAIFAFVRLAEDDASRELVLGAFGRLVEIAKKNKRLINSVAYHALAHATLDMPWHPDIAPALHGAFRIAAELTDLEVHYNMNQACGAFAIALATLEYRKLLDDLAKFHEKLGHYEGEPFHAQVLYAQWMLEGDGESAKAYVTDSDQIKVLGYAAAALADLDHKPGRGALMARMGGRLQAESREAMLEASKRLRLQNGPPEIADRMIWMFGRVSPVEIALGSETDNELRQRAQAKRS